MDRRVSAALGAAAVVGVVAGVLVGARALVASVGGDTSQALPAATSSATPADASSPSGGDVTLSASASAEPGSPSATATSASPTATRLTPSPTSSTARPTTSPTARSSPSPSRTMVGVPVSPSGSYRPYTPTPAGTPSPSMALVLYRTSPDGANLVVQARISALLPVLSGGDALVSRTVTFGDGATAATPSAQHCVAGAAAQPVDQTWPYQHTYTRPGTYLVTFTAVACAPVGVRVTTLAVTVV